MFPDEATDAHAVGDNCVSFEEVGGPGAPELVDAYAAGGVVVLSSIVEGFPVSLVEAMFCGRATVSTDVGAVVEVIGGTGLVVPRGIRGRSPTPVSRCCATRSAANGWAPPRGPARSNSSPSSRIWRRSAPSTWS